MGATLCLWKAGKPELAAEEGVAPHHELDSAAPDRKVLARPLWERELWESVPLSQAARSACSR
jgi:hypothetical protein